MKHHPVLLESPRDRSVTKENSPGFFRLFQQTILLVLKEQGVLDQEQYQASLEFLEKS